VREHVCQLVEAAFGWQDADYTETELLCTKLCEDEIVHGGEELLARTILEARELEVPIMFVLTSCGPEIVGDDIIAVCEDMRPQVDFEIVPIECAGYEVFLNTGPEVFPAGTFLPGHEIQVCVFASDLADNGSHDCVIIETPYLDNM